jgi:hypothetical protein
MHEHDLPDDSTDTKYIGIFTSRQKAQKAVAFLSTQRGFRDSKEGFIIGRVHLNEVGWEEGFVTVPLQPRKRSDRSR